MNDDLAQEAIHAALAANWEKALQINQQILHKDSSNVDTLNRLGRAYAELGDIKKARECVQKVLKIDPFNSIAKKALERWNGMKNGDKAAASGPMDPQAFLEEPGKTKIVELMHLGNAETLSEIDAGEEVKFNCHSHRVSILSTSGKYIGRLPDDLSARMRKLDQLGYQYSMYLKSVDKSGVKVLIRETKRPAKLSDMPSFPAEKMTYISFTPPELVRDESTNSNEEDDGSE